MYMAHERREYILRLLEERGRVRSAALALDLGVTDETIRTDLVLLQKKGLLRRVHGGAVHLPAGRPGRSTLSAYELRLAEEAAQNLREGQSIYLDDTRLSLALAVVLEETPCTLITGSARLLHALAAARGQKRRILCPGGELVGRLLDSPAARNGFRSLPLDAAFLVPDSLSPTEVGYLDPVRAAWAQLAAEKAGRVMVAASDKSFAAEAPHRFACHPDLLLVPGEPPPAFGQIPRRVVPSPID